jgi:hypothetical protein
MVGIYTCCCSIAGCYLETKPPAQAVVRPFGYTSAITRNLSDSEGVVLRALRDLKSVVYGDHLDIDTRSTYFSDDNLSCSGDTGVVECSGAFLGILAFAAADMANGAASDESLFSASTAMFAPPANSEADQACAGLSLEKLPEWLGGPPNGSDVPSTSVGEPVIEILPASPMNGPPIVQPRRLGFEHVESARELLAIPPRDSERLDARTLRATSRYVVGFIVGHELTHALHRCVLEPPDPELEAAYRALPHVQTLDAPCATELHLRALSKPEVQADLCGAQAVARLSALRSRFELTDAQDETARRQALQLLTLALMKGLDGEVSPSVIGQVPLDEEYLADGVVGHMLGFCQRECWMYGWGDRDSAVPAETCAAYCEPKEGFTPPPPQAAPSAEAAASTSCERLLAAEQEREREREKIRAAPSPIANPDGPYAKDAFGKVGPEQDLFSPLSRSNLASSPATVNYASYAQCMTTRPPMFPLMKIATTVAAWKRVCNDCATKGQVRSAAECSSCKVLVDRVEQSVPQYQALRRCASEERILGGWTFTRDLPPQGYPYPLLRAELLRLAMKLPEDAFGREALLAGQKELLRDQARCRPTKPDSANGNAPSDATRTDVGTIEGWLGGVRAHLHGH